MGKTIHVSNGTHEWLKEHGNLGDSFEDVIIGLLIEREFGSTELTDEVVESLVFRGITEYRGENLEDRL